MAATESIPVRGDARRSALAGTALIAAGVLPGFLTASLAPRIRLDFPFGASALGLAIAGFYVACAVCSTPAGRLVERIGARRGMYLAALTAAAALASAASVGMISFLVLYSVDHGIGEAPAGLLLGGMSLTATLSRVGLGMIADRSGRDPLRLTAVVLASSTVGYLLLITGEPAIIVVAALLVGGVGWSWPGTLTLAVVLRQPDAPAWAVGVMMSGLFAGAAGGPLLVGALAEHGAFAAAWALCAGLALASAGTIAVTRSHEERALRA